MTDAAVRVVLLARAGSARDHLHRALSDLGATLIAEGDPGDLDPVQIADQSPNLVLVSLEPAIEAALDRFDALLATPGIEVMYDDAEVTRHLEGWDLNRWARHLAAKLLGSDPLPPTPGDADPVPDLNIAPRPGLPPTPAELMDGEKLEDYAQDAVDLADWVPVNRSLMTPDGNASVTLEPDQAIDEISFEFDPGDLDQALKAMDAAASAAVSASTETERPIDTGDDGGLDIEIDLSTLAQPQHDASADHFLDDGDAEVLLADRDYSGESVRFSSFSESAPADELDDLDADVAALALQLEAFENTQPKEQVRDLDFSQTPYETTPAPIAQPIQAPVAAPSTGGSDFSGLSLVAMDEVIVAARGGDASTAGMFSASTLSLEPIDGETSSPESAPQTVTGVVVIFAGLGGPDAVRQLVSSLPEKLPVPILLYQHLEVGKHERLVDQLGKISRLPVILAEAGALAQPGKINVLPTGLSASREDTRWRFVTGALRQMLDDLAAESVVVMLSGADPDLVPAALALRDNGGLALAQDPKLCFDPAAAQAMHNQATAVYPALDLARQIAARWSL